MGNDTLSGGAGNDLLTGGVGMDQILYNTNAFVASGLGIDTITPSPVLATQPEFIPVAGTLFVSATG